MEYLSNRERQNLAAGLARDGRTFEDEDEDSVTADEQGYEPGPFHGQLSNLDWARFADEARSIGSCMVGNAGR